MNYDTNITNEGKSTRHASPVTRHGPISWTVEYRGIRLINRETGNILFLPWPEAALWDMIEGNIESERITDVISAITCMDKEETVLWIKKTISLWEEGKWVVTK
ncbi:MAG: hypothetical protein ABRQ38_16180 [Candidatus Eremiobacterota bacterium]